MNGSARWAAAAAFALAAVSAAGAVHGVLRHALLLAIGFRALTAWRLVVAAGALWRGDPGRGRTVRLAAAGSGIAHLMLICSVVGEAMLGTAPHLQRACVLAQRCSPVYWATVPLGVLGLAHAVWLSSEGIGLDRGR